MYSETSWIKFEIFQLLLQSLHACVALIVCTFLHLVMIINCHVVFSTKLSAVNQVPTETRDCSNSIGGDLYYEMVIVRL